MVPGVTSQYVTLSHEASPGFARFFGNRRKTWWSKLSENERQGSCGSTAQTEGEWEFWEARGRLLEHWESSMAPLMIRTLEDLKNEASIKRNITLKCVLARRGVSSTRVPTIVIICDDKAFSRRVAKALESSDGFRASGFKLLAFHLNRHLKWPVFTEQPLVQKTRSSNSEFTGQTIGESSSSQKAQPSHEQLSSSFERVQASQEEPASDRREFVRLPDKREKATVVLAGLIVEDEELWFISDTVRREPSILPQSFKAELSRLFTETCEELQTEAESGLQKDACEGFRHIMHRIAHNITILIYDESFAYIDIDEPERGILETHPYIWNVERIERYLGKHLGEKINDVNIADDGNEENLTPPKVDIEAFLHVRRLWASSQAPKKLRRDLKSFVERPEALRQDIYQRWGLEAKSAPPIDFQDMDEIKIITPTKDDGDSVSDRLKLMVEDLCQEKWDWTPLKPPRRPLTRFPDHVRLQWKCSCGILDFVYVTADLAHMVQKAISEGAFKAHESRTQATLSPSSQRDRTCPYCSKFFATGANYTTHLEKHCEKVPREQPASRVNVEYDIATNSSLEPPQPFSNLKIDDTMSISKDQNTLQPEPNILQKANVFPVGSASNSETTASVGTGGKDGSKSTATDHLSVKQGSTQPQDLNQSSPSHTTSARNGASNHAQDQSPGRYILFCLPQGRDLLPVQLDVASCTDDEIFFGKVRAAYRELRGPIRYWLSPRRFSHCDFSRITRYFVGHLEKGDNELPEHPEYEYVIYPPHTPRTPYIAPIREHEWFHRFHRSIVTTGFLEALPLIPKRRKIFEVHTHARGREDMWGLHVSFCFSLKGVFFYFVASTVVGVIFWILWLLRHPDDWQTAVVPFTTILALVATCGFIFGEEFKRVL